MEWKFSEVRIAPVYSHSRRVLLLPAERVGLLIACRHKASHVEVLTLERKAHTDKFTEVEDRYAGYTVYDQHYEKIGNVDDLFLDESDQPESDRREDGLPGTRTT